MKKIQRANALLAEHECISLSEIEHGGNVDTPPVTNESQYVLDRLERRAKDIGI